MATGTSRRRFLRAVGGLVALGGAGMLAACQSQPETIVVTPSRGGATAVPTSAPPAPTNAAATPSAATSSAAPTKPGLPASATPAAAARPAEMSAPLGPGKAQYQIDWRHSGVSPHAGPARHPNLLRNFFMTDPGVETTLPGHPFHDLQSSASIAPDGTIYLGNFLGNMVALRDPGSGERLELRWRFHPPGASSFHTTPAIGRDGTIYAGFSTGGLSPEAKATFYALRAPESGFEARVLWSVELGPGRQTSSPLLGPDGTIYVVSGKGKLFAVSPEGQVRWTVQTGPSLKATPALGPDGTVYLASMDGKLYAVQPPAGNAQEATVRWAFEFGQHPGSGPAVVDKVPPFGADGIGSGASPTIGPDGSVYVGACNSNFYAVAPDGKMRWMFEAEREVAGIWSSAALGPDGKTLYFGANKGGIYAVDRESGKLRWQSPIYGSIFSSPVIDSQGILYTASTVGHVLALDTASGKRIWDYAFPTQRPSNVKLAADGGVAVWTSPAIRPDGTLVVADRHGQVALLGQ